MQFFGVDFWVSLIPLLINSLAINQCLRPPDHPQQCIVPFWSRELMGSVLQQTDFDFIASVKNEGGKKNANFRGFRARFQIF